MATTATMLSKIRLDLGDLPTPFSFAGTGDGSKTAFFVGAKPIDGTTLIVKVAGVTKTLTTHYTVDARNGIVTLLTAPVLSAAVTVTGTQFRYFSDADLTIYLNSAASLQIGSRNDIHGYPMSMASMPFIEEQALSIYATIQALWALATDAAFDIDIYAPDGVNIPRSERYRQLLQLIEARQAQYKEMAELLGIGIYRLETFTYRRISLGTGRLVPVYRAREVDDVTPPVRVNLPIDTYGGIPNTEMLTVYNINIYQGNPWIADFDFPFALTNKTLTAKIRRYANSEVILATILCQVTNSTTGVARLSLTSDQTDELPEKATWDLVVTNTDNTAIRETFIRGAVFTERAVTNR